MKAIGYTACHKVEHPEAFLDLDIPAPGEPEGHDMLVAVRAMSVNPVDTKRRRSEEPKDGPRILGFDAAGVVRAVGPLCTLFRPGDEVFYAGVVNRAGSNAELQLVDERIVGRKPASLSFAEAAAMPLTTITAWEGLHDRLGLHEGGGVGEALLLVGGAGGVGSMVIQIARQRTALTVVATASRPESAAWCRELGAHHIVDHREDIAAQLKAIGVRPRYVFSTNTTARNWEQIVASVAPQGAIVLIESQAPIDARQLMPKSVSLHWELMFTRPMFGTPDMIEQHHLLNAVAGMVDHGRIRHTMTRNLGAATAERLREAHAMVESGTMVGKVVLEGL
jgi:zinc-binding alcohol dehydrogenase family protein